MAATPDKVQDYPDNTVAVFDLDGTLTRRDTFIGILRHTVRRYPAALVGLHRLAGPAIAFKLGRLDNTAVKRAFLRDLLSRVPAQRLEMLVHTFLEGLFERGFRRDALAALAGHQATGHETLLLSAAPDFYVEEIARRLRFDHCLCTGTVRRPDGGLTGELSTANCRGAEKLARLKRHFNISFYQYYYVGYADDESDLPLLEALDAGVLVNARPAARERARRSGLQVADWR